MKKGSLSIAFSYYLKVIDLLFLEGIDKQPRKISFWQEKEVSLPKSLKDPLGVVKRMKHKLCQSYSEKILL